MGMAGGLLGGSGGSGGFGGYGSAIMTIFSIGYMLYNLFSGEDEEKLDEEKITFSNWTRNTPVPICYGTDKYAGVLIAIGESGAEVITYGGKGGMATPEQQQLVYYAEFAMAFAEGEIRGYADVLVNDTSITEEEVNYDFEPYLGSSDQIINPDLEAFFADLVDPMIPFRNTAYLYLSGTLGQVTTIPTITATVSGLLCYDSGVPTLDWEHDSEQEEDFVWEFDPGVGGDSPTYSWEGLLGFHKGGGFYQYDFDNGYIYYWDSDTTIEKTLINFDVSLGATPLVDQVNLITRVEGDLIYCLAVRVGRYYDFFYIDTVYNTVTSIIKDQQYPDSHDMFNEGLESMGIGSMEIVGDIVYLFGGNSSDTGLYCSKYFVLMMSKSSGFGSGPIPYSISGDPDTYYSVWNIEANPVLGYPRPNCATVQLGNELLGYVIAVQFIIEAVGGYAPHVRKFMIAAGTITAILYDSNAPDDYASRHCIIDSQYYNGYVYMLVWDNGGASGSSPNIVSLYRTADSGFSSRWENEYETFELIWTTSSNPSGGNIKSTSMRNSHLILYNGKLYFKVYHYIMEYDFFHSVEISAELSLITDIWMCNLRSSYKRASITFNSGIIYSLDNLFCSLEDANPIAVTYDFMTNTRYGLGLDPDLFDGAPLTSGTWNTEYLYCNEAIRTEEGDLESRFLFSNVFMEKMKGFDIVRQVLQTCRGFLYYCDGKIKVKIEKPTEVPVLYFGSHKDIFTSTAPGSSSLTRIYVDFSDYPDDYFVGDLGTVQYSTGYGEDPKTADFIVINQTSTYLVVADDFDCVMPEGSIVNIRKDNIKKGSFIYSEKSHNDFFNSVRLEFSNRDDKYRTDILEKHNVYDIDVVSNGEVREKTYQMSGIKRETQAGRMLTFLDDYENLIRWKCNFDTDIVGMMLCYGDLVGVTKETELGWFAKLFRVVELEENPNYECRLGLLEYNPNIYHDKGDAKRDIYDTSPDSKFEVPDHVTHLTLIEEYGENIITLLFAKPEVYNPYWVGAYIYHRNETQDTWENLGVSYVYSGAVKLDRKVFVTDRKIYYDDTTLNGVLPEKGSFILDDEEIYYTDIDTVDCCFVHCTRGYRHTAKVRHESTAYCVIRKAKAFTYEYSTEDIGLLHYFKAVSFTIYQIFADGSTAPEETIMIEGLNTVPFSVSSLKVICN